MVHDLVRIISRRRLREFWAAGHADAQQPLRAWFAMVKAAKWEGPADVKGMFPHASFLAGNRIVFNVGGNNYRLIVKVIYEKRRVYIRFVGTHAAYDKVDAERV